MREVESRKCPKELSQQFTYMDCRAVHEPVLNMEDLVSLNYRTGIPAKMHLMIPIYINFVRNVASNVFGCTLSVRLCNQGHRKGHISIQTTMDRYVQVTTDSLVSGTQRFEQNSTDIESQAGTP